MDQFTRDRLKELIEQPGTPCISIYLPTHRAGAEIQQDPIRLKNLLQQAEDGLAQAGQTNTQVNELLEQVRNQLLLDVPFWQHGSDGLAVFIAPELLRYFRLPLIFDEKAVVADQFYVKPLFGLFQDEGRFYVLALSQNEVRLLEGTRYHVEALDLGNVPTSRAEALKWDDPERQLQQHPVSRGSGRGGAGRPDTMFHGHGVGTDDEKINLLRYFRIVDKGLQSYLADERVPLVLAGVDYLIPIYREASSYKYLSEKAITGNPEELRDEELHAHAWKLLEPEFKNTQQAAALLYQEQAGKETPQASNQIEEIIQAAYGGRVSQLFIRQGAEVWGSYDRATNQVNVHKDQTDSSEDLLNIAACDTFLNGGTVFVAEAENMPDSSPAAAIFRY